MGKETPAPKLVFKDLPGLTSGTRPETFAPGRTLVLPDGKTIDHLYPKSHVSTLLSKLLEKQPDGSLATIPLEDFFVGNLEDKKQRHLVDVRISDSRRILRNKGWTIVLFKKNDENGKERTFVSLRKIEKPIEDKTEPNPPDHRSNKSDPYGLLDGVPEFLEFLTRLRQQPTSSPVPESPKDEVRS